MPLLYGEGRATSLHGETVTHVILLSEETEHVAYLNCRYKPFSRQEAGVVGLYLKNMGLPLNPSIKFMRVDVSKFRVGKEDEFLSERLTELYIPQNLTAPGSYRTSRVAGFHIGHIKSYGRYLLKTAWPPGAWDSTNGIFKICEPGKMVQIRALFVPQTEGLDRASETPRVLCLLFNGTRTAVTSRYSVKTLEAFEYSGAAYFVSWDYTVDAEPAYDAGFKPGPWKVTLSGLEFREGKLVIPVTLDLPRATL